MAFDADDAIGLSAQLQACLRDAHAALDAWRLPDTSDACMVGAWHAERRAMERARVGVARGQLVGQGLSEVEGIRLQLDCYRRAVWPQGEELGEHTHGLLLDRIQSGELVDLERDAIAHGAVAPGIASLAALPMVAESKPEGSSGDSASLSGTSSHSSAWSVYSDGTLVPSDAPTFWPPIDQMTLAMQSHILSPQARAAVAPPVTVSSAPVPESPS